MAALLKYISSYNLSDDSLAAATDSTNWAINEALIKSIRIITDAIDWDLTIYCDSNPSDGMFTSIKVAANLSGEQTILLDLPYIDNDSNNSVHCLFVDNTASNGATIEIFGQKARTS